MLDEFWKLESKKKNQIKSWYLVKELYFNQSSTTPSSTAMDKIIGIIGVLDKEDENHKRHKSIYTPPNASTLALALDMSLEPLAL